MSALLDIASRKDYLAEISYAVVTEVLKTCSAGDLGLLRGGMCPRLGEIFAGTLGGAERETHTHTYTHMNSYSHTHLFTHTLVHTNAY